MKGTLQVAAAVLLVGAGVACTRGENRAANEADRDRTAMASPSPTADPYGTTSGTGMRDATPDAGDIAGNPARYAGQQVTIKSDVKKLMPNGFFTLDDNDLLVLSPSGQPIEDQEVTIHGTVQTYSAPELKSRYAWFKSDSSIDREYKDRAVIVADSILTADGREIVGGAGSALPAGSGEARPPLRP
jgi:hypothetical protein